MYLLRKPLQITCAAVFIIYGRKMSLFSQKDSWTFPPSWKVRNLQIFYMDVLGVHSFPPCLVVESPSVLAPSVHVWLTPQAAVALSVDLSCWASKHFGCTAFLRFPADMRAHCISSKPISRSSLFICLLSQGHMWLLLALVLILRGKLCLSHTPHLVFQKPGNQAKEKPPSRNDEGLGPPWLAPQTFYTFVLRGALEIVCFPEWGFLNSDSWQSVWWGVGISGYFIFSICFILEQCMALESEQREDWWDTSNLKNDCFKVPT